MGYLPEVKDVEHYKQLFAQKDTGFEAVQHLAKKHGLQGEASRSVRGSHIVYRVGKPWVKIMAPLFARDMGYEIAGLENVQGRLSVATPTILAKGYLDNWVYVVLSHIEGQRIGDIWSGLSQSTQNDLSYQIGTITKEIQSCPLHELIVARGDWNTFIRARLQSMLEHHKEKNMHPEWLAQLQPFLTRFLEDEFTLAQPVFLHADLTFDHFLVDNLNTKPSISGVIDFADCRVGHPEYDVPATAAFIFKGNAQALHSYFLGMGYKAADLNERFYEKMLAWTCLHYFSDLRNYFTQEMLRVPAGDFAALARVVYPFCR